MRRGGKLFLGKFAVPVGERDFRVKLISRIEALVVGELFGREAYAMASRTDLLFALFTPAHNRTHLRLAHMTGIDGRDKTVC